MSAAVALGNIGPEEAKVAIPVVIEALKDENRDVRWYAAIGLEQIATALQERKDTTAIPDLEMALIALRAATSKNTHGHQAVEGLHQAVEALKAIEKAR